MFGLFKSQKQPKKVGEFDFEQKCNIIPAQNVTGVWRGTIATIQVGLLTSTIGRYAARGTLKGKLGVPQLMSFEIEDEPSTVPLPQKVIGPAITMKESLNVTPLCDSEDVKAIPYMTISDYHELYKSKKSTPSEVAEKLIANLPAFMNNKGEVSGINYQAICEIKEDVIREQAKASTERYKSGSFLSVLDGVPFFSKEEIPVKGYTRRYGTDLVEEVNQETVFAIKRLTDSGAIHCGTTKMVMFGTSPLGCNPVSDYGSPRNPNNPDYYCGGSSCGCACIVSAGLVPFSLAVDGLGSIRIPSSACGAVGLKSTYSRVSISPQLNFKHYSSHYGPIACCVRDASIVYGAICGPDEQFEIGTHQPQPILPVLSPMDLSSIKIVMCPSYVQLASSGVVEAFNSLVNKLKSDHHASISEINIPEMHESCCAMSIMSIQNSKNVRDKITEDGFSKIKDSFARMNLTMGLDFTDEEVTQARKQCSRMMAIMSRIFENADFMLLPTISSTAYPRSPEDDSNGVVDVEYLHGCTMFSFLGSATGVPAITIKLGANKDTNLPMGLQILAPWWKEDRLLQFAHSLEKILNCFNTPLSHLTTKGL